MANAVKEISYEDLLALLKQNQNLVLVDVRSKAEVDNGHISGSINIPLDTVESAFKLPPEEFKSKYGKVKPEKDSDDLVFHCQMGRRGAMATTKVYQLGYSKARNYAGGYAEWSKKQKK
ncbi:thiosulfate:glutathione sulfurtransferase [Oryzias melastigma]|uniref:Thiosulfate:glutathione sulfurtransferase-like n=1 Tax=Oryzias melastigma TaxID=30732 RepID=A0A3B3CL84_ORYME|nr:thiosulfate:glutathione sulfurtransferase [Oryzias melastigma]